jgi:hypothetical protein
MVKSKRSYFISPSKSNAMIDETMTGSHIVFEDRTYNEISRAPRGKRVLKRLTSVEGTEKLIIYT